MLTWTKTDATHTCAEAKFFILKHPTTRRFQLFGHSPDPLTKSQSLAACKEEAERLYEPPVELPPGSVPVPEGVADNPSPPDDEPPAATDPPHYAVKLADEPPTAERNAWSDTLPFAPLGGPDYQPTPSDRAGLIALHIADEGRDYGRAALSLVGKGMARLVRKALRRMGHPQLAGLRAA